MGIHPTAIINKSSQMDSSAEIGPHVIIDSDVKIGPNVTIMANAYILKYTEIGEGTKIHAGAVLGDVPQDLAFQDKPSYLKIGKYNVIREHVTMHRGTKEGSSTLVGDKNYFMANSHVGHNCSIGNNVIIANGSLLGGYVMVEDSAFISGNVVIHQFCRIGKLSMIGGFSGVNKDVPPYMSVRGPSVVWSINLVGLRRAKFDRKTINEIKEAYNLIYQSNMNTEEALKKILEKKISPEIAHLVNFIKNSKRGICRYRWDEKEFFEYGSAEEKNIV